MRRDPRRRALVFGAGASGVLALAAGLILDSGAFVSGAPATAETPAPVALAASPLVVAVDRRGNVLPIDPADPVLDLPVLRVLTPWAEAQWGLRALARDVGHMAETAPEVFAVISEARIGDHDIALLLGDSEVRIRYLPPITEMRLREAIIALNDAVERLEKGSPREVDLRFADQVVVRTR